MTIQEIDNVIDALESIEVRGYANLMTLTRVIQFLGAKKKEQQVEGSIFGTATVQENDAQTEVKT
ncbi:MAG TPA: hypothetical protein PLT28_00380 [Saprospiraceae bacterium]|nr:hypothetical protein [Saprospiraceae bacterium]